MTFYWTTKYSFWNYSQFKKYDLLPDAPYGLFLPFNQNFLSHTYKDCRIDVNKIDFGSNNNISIDFSEYATGVTVQQLYEIRCFRNAVEDFAMYFRNTHPNGTLEYKAINPLKTMKGKSFHQKHIQPNNDFEGTMHFKNLSLEKTLPADVKSIVYPVQKGNLIAGNFLNTPSYSFRMHLGRLSGLLTNYEGPDRSLKVFGEWTDNLKEISKRSKKKLSIEEDALLEQEFKEELYRVLCDTHFKDIFPSIIKEISYNDTTFDEVVLNNVSKTLQNPKIIIQKYFPSMGNETTDYHQHIEKYIKTLPSEELQQIEKSYSILLKFLNNAPLI